MTEANAVLANYSLGGRHNQIEPLGSAGGMSGAQFWRISVGRLAVPSVPGLAPSGSALREPSGLAQTDTYILRRWPAVHPSPERLRFIHGVLRHAASRGCVFLPVPVTAQTGESFVSHAGHLWELAPWMPGIADYEHSSSPEKLRAALATLATFHNAVADFRGSTAPGSAGGSNAVTRHLTRLRDLTPAAITQLNHSITSSTWPDLAPLARQFVAALPTAVPKAIAQLEPLAATPFALQPCLRDIWHDHILFTGNEVTGLVDFGAIDIDTPATDIARLLGSLASPTPLPNREGQGEGSINFAPRTAQPWQTGLSAYNKVRPLSPAETRATHALHTSGTILAGCNWIRWIYTDGKTFDNPAQIVERFRRILAALTTS